MTALMAPSVSWAQANRSWRTETGTPPARAASPSARPSRIEHARRQVGAGILDHAEAPELGLAFDEDIVRVHAGPRDRLPCVLVSFEDAIQQMERLDLGVLAFVGQRLGGLDDVAGVGCVGLEAQCQGAHGWCE